MRREACSKFPYGSEYKLLTKAAAWFSSYLTFVKLEKIFSAALIQLAHYLRRAIFATCIHYLSASSVTFDMKDVLTFSQMCFLKR